MRVEFQKKATSSRSFTYYKDVSMRKYQRQAGFLQRLNDSRCKVLKRCCPILFLFFPPPQRDVCDGFGKCASSD